MSDFLDNDDQTLHSDHHTPPEPVNTLFREMRMNAYRVIYEINRLSHTHDDSLEHLRSELARLNSLCDNVEKLHTVTMPH